MDIGWGVGVGVRVNGIVGVRVDGMGRDVCVIVGTEVAPDVWGTEMGAQLVRKKRPNHTNTCVFIDFSYKMDTCV